MGGRPITIAAAPYQVSYGDVCGGALIAKTWALTAAHCGTEKNFIRIGSTFHEQGVEIRITSHNVHPRYKERHEYDFDIQLLKLKRPLHFGKNVKAIKIAEHFVDHLGVVVVSGWGYTKEKADFNSYLLQVKLPIVPLSDCQEVKQAAYNYTLTARMFCAGGKSGVDACQGDSGGGAICPHSWSLFGLSSFGYGCGRVPGVYTKITHVAIRGWIRNHTGI